MLSTRVQRYAQEIKYVIDGDCPFCLKTEKHIDHIFKECDLTTNVWYTIVNNRPDPINTNIGIIDWLEYFWLDISWYRKRFDDVLKKVTIIVWAIWPQKQCNF